MGNKQIKIKKQLLLLLLSLVLLITDGIAQEIEEDDTPIKVDTLLLTMPFTVADKNGRNIAGLKKENFSIFQNGEEQDIEYFFNEEAPMNVAILIDTSASTEKALDKIQKAVRDFVKILRREDKGIIVSFDYRTVFLSELSSDKKKLSKAIEQTRIADQTGSDINEAIFQIVNNHFASFKGRKAIIALTDGMVIKRAVSSQQTMDVLQKSDTIFYPIIFKTKFYTEAIKRAAVYNRKPMSIELLEILAQETAGRIYEKEAANLKEAFQSIAEELKNQYLIGFYPDNSGKSLGNIKFEVDRKELMVRTKKRWKF
ncbi:MAG: VWA domain-containing protein [Acidobacteriota bacterium]|nr:VWA domain-containing protein [Acidobacteriota bacterium]